MFIWDIIWVFARTVLKNKILKCPVTGHFKLKSMIQYDGNLTTHT